MSSMGNKGKFIEKLKNILRFRRKKRNADAMSNIQIEDSNTIYTNFLKIMASIPGFVYGNMKNDADTVEKSKSQNVVIVKNIELNNGSMVKNIDKPYILNKAIKTEHISDISHGKDINEIRLENRHRINNINVNEIKKSQESFDSFKYIIEKQVDIDNCKGQKKAKELEKSIINLIKKKLIKIVNELEILQSELYILSEVNGDKVVLAECQRELDQVKSILCKIDKLKEQYDFLKDNYDFEYLLEIDDNNLVDKIIELKDDFGKNRLKALSEDYKLLDIYKYLYLKIDDLQQKTFEFESAKEKEVAKLKERDVDFEKLKNDVYNIDSVKLNYEQFVSRQNDLLHDIDEKVNKINSYEQISYHLKGFGKLFMNTFKYFGLLMISPLKGIIPSIATETIITGNLIKNLYQNLEWKETKKTVYEAIDYSNLIEGAINDLESTNRIVDMTLEDIVHLKMKYNEEFKKNQDDFVEYRDIMHKISDMENKILGSKIKIEMMRQRALEQQRENSRKMVLVRKLNENENQQ